MQNGKTEGVNDEQNKTDVHAKTRKTETRHANDQATKKVMRRRNKVI